MSARGTVVQQVVEGSLDSLLSLAEQALWNDTLRRAVMRQLEKRVLAHLQKSASPYRPPQVTRDKMDLMRALIRSIDRAMERKQVSRTVVRRLLRVLVVNTILRQSEDIEAAERSFMQRHEGHAPPITMVLSPTKVCNLHCIGCYANSSQGTVDKLEWDIVHRIVSEAKTLWGMRFFTISGGEPLAYRSQGKGILDLFAEHEDCFFMMYTNGTLIDRRVAEQMAQAGNIVPAISVEGLEERTDARRGRGVFRRILEAMEHLREAGVVFGISLTATRHNAEEILSDEFVDFFFEQQQAVFGWLFQYMPIGRGFTLELLPTPEQRVWMWRRTWQLIRERNIMLADFWNCGTVSDGCIAAGRDAGYLYIDWSGKVMPCVFVPYSPVNIHDIYRRGGTLDDIYDLPYFRAIRQWQWDYGFGKQRPEEHGNWLIPCSIRDHHCDGRAMIDRYRPEPEDESAADALRDPSYYQGLLAYDEKLREKFDPIWQQEYLSEIQGGRNRSWKSCASSQRT